MKKTLTESQLYDYIYNQVLTTLNEVEAPVDPNAAAGAMPTDPAAAGAAPAGDNGGQLNGTSSTAVDKEKANADAGNKKAVQSFNPQGGKQDDQQQAAAPQQQAQQPQPQQQPSQQAPQPIKESELSKLIENELMKYMG